MEVMEGVNTAIKVLSKGKIGEREWEVVNRGGKIILKIPHLSISNK